MSFRVDLIVCLMMTVSQRDARVARVMCCSPASASSKKRGKFDRVNKLGSMRVVISHGAVRVTGSFQTKSRLHASQKSEHLRRGPEGQRILSARITRFLKRGIIPLVSTCSRESHSIECDVSDTIIAEVQSPSLRASGGSHRIQRVATTFPIDTMYKVCY